MKLADLMDPTVRLEISGRPVIARRGPTSAVVDGEQRQFVELWTAGGPAGPDAQGEYLRYMLRDDVVIQLGETPAPISYSVPG